MIKNKTRSYLSGWGLALGLSATAAHAQQPTTEAAQPLAVPTNPPFVVEPAPSAPVVSERPAAAQADADALTQLSQRVRDLEQEVRRSPVQPGTPQPFAAPQTETFAARWRNAFVLQSTDERFRLRVGGLVQADGRYFVDRSNPPPADQLNQFLLRRARIDLEADVWGLFSVRIQPDFAGGKIVVFDAYADIKLLPELRFRFGKFKVPFGLERLQPASSIAFVERGFPTEISPNRDLGVQISGDLADASVSYAVAVFNGNVDNSTIDAALDDDKEVAARLYLQPFRRTRIQSLRCLGFGGAFTYGVRNGSMQSPNVLAIHSFGQAQIFGFSIGTTALDTTVASGSRLRWTAQAAYYFWRIGLLGEYVSTTYNVQKGANAASLNFSAWQAEATLLLTRDTASYTGVVPQRHFAPWQRSWGAVEMVFRYGGLQIDQSAFDGAFVDVHKSVQAAQNFVVGINWYLTANTRLSFDYARTDFSGGATGGARAAENAFIGRMQFAM
jgi:phosphate-selective porin OprO/OprP